LKFRIGNGYDVHQLVKGRKLVLGGVEIPSEFGLLGHSDADVLLHAISDALLGALALGDIGIHFPDTAAENKDIDSRVILKKSYDLVLQHGYRLVNCDTALVLEKPKIAPYLLQMRKSIAEVLSCGIEDVSVKATTSEKMGFVGRGEGAVAYAVVLLEKTESV